MKIVFFGTPTFVIPVLTSLVDNFNVVGVVTTPDTYQGRKKILTPTPVKQYAHDNNIAPVITDEHFTDETKKQLSLLSPDLFITAAYGKLIPEDVLSIAKIGSLNIHPSLLPKYRGPSPIQAAIMHGDNETGVSIIQMDEELDHGPILAQEKILLHGTETFVSLHKELFEKAAMMLPDAIMRYAQKSSTLLPQNEKDVIWCKKITKEDGYFESAHPPKKHILDRMIRAYTPWPTAWTKISINNHELRLKFHPDRKIQPEGGKIMTIKDFFNGYPELKETVEKILNA